jgi:hypothetical protein
MGNTRRLTAVMACALVVSCSDSSENPLANGLTPDQQAFLIEETIEQIEATENYTPDNFEQLQLKHFESITEEMQDAAQGNLRKRLDKIALLGMSQSIELDRDTAEVDSRMQGPRKVQALVSVVGNRTYRINEATGTSKSGFILPWVITVDDGELVFRHQGIRRKDLKD